MGTIIGQIYDGVKNYAIPNQEIENLSAYRYNICLKCEYFTPKKRCRKCGCFMKIKTRSTKAKCPLKYW